MHSQDVGSSLLAMVSPPRDRQQSIDDLDVNPVRPSKFVHFVASLVSNASYVILFVWLAVTIGCAFPALEVNDHVSQDTPPPAHSQAAQGKAFFKKWFPEQEGATGFVIFSNALNESIDLGLDPRYTLFDRAVEYFCKFGTLNFSRNDSTPVPATGTTQVLAYTSFRAIDVSPYIPVAVGLSYLAPGNRSALMTVAFGNSYTSSNVSNFDKDLQDALATLTEDYNLTSLVKSRVFSYPTFLEEISSSAAGDTETMFTIVVPIAFAVFGLALSSARLLIMPLLSIAATYSFAFAILDGVAKSTPLDSMAPSICVFLLLSYVMTYAFYFMSQYRKQLKENKIEACDPLLALEQLYTTAGRSVFISCATVCLSGVGLTLFEVSLVRSTGIAIIVVVLSTMLVTLTLIPALVASFPIFFAGAIDVWIDAYNPSVLAAKDAASQPTPAAPNPDAPTGRESYRPPPPEELKPAAHERFHSAFITYVAGSPQRYAFAVLALGISFVLVSFAFDGIGSNNLDQYMPKSEMLDDWETLKTIFRAGEVFPYNLFFLTPSAVLDEAYFNNTQEIIYTLCNLLPSTSPKDFDGITVDGTQSGYLANGGNISFSELDCLGTNPGKECFFRLIQAYVVFKSQIGPATYATFKPKFDPVSPLGIKWYEQAKALLPSLGAKYGYELYLTGFGADSYDAVEYAQSITGEVAGITVAIVFVCVAVAFGSLTLPLLVCLSTFISVASAFGIANLIYGHDVLHFLKVESLAGEAGNIAWQVPILCLTICTGLVLNFEVIVLIKVFGRRWRGVSSREAVVEGFIGVGREVSISALMSLINFGGLAAGSIPAINQIGVFFFAATAVQAFIMRPFLTLSIMVSLGEWNWWPLQLCKENMCAPVGVEEDAEERPTLIDAVDYRRSMRRSHFRASAMLAEHAPAEEAQEATSNPAVGARTAASVRLPPTSVSNDASVPPRDSYGTL